MGLMCRIEKGDAYTAFAAVARHSFGQACGSEHTLVYKSLDISIDDMNHINIWNKFVHGRETSIQSGSMGYYSPFSTALRAQ